MTYGPVEALSEDVGPVQGEAMSTWNDDTLITWILVLLAVVMLIGTIVFQLLAPCSWLMWEAAKDLPGRCVPGLTR
jgi:hypothetical protein